MNSLTFLFILLIEFPLLLRLFIEAESKINILCIYEHQIHKIYLIHRTPQVYEIQLIKLFFVCWVWELFRFFYFIWSKINTYYLKS